MTFTGTGAILAGSPSCCHQRHT